jgi:hypothetical protein
MSPRIDAVEKVADHHGPCHDRVGAVLRKPEHLEALSTRQTTKSGLDLGNRLRREFVSVKSRAGDGAAESLDLREVAHRAARTDEAPSRAELAQRQAVEQRIDVRP